MVCQRGQQHTLVGICEGVLPPCCILQYLHYRAACIALHPVLDRWRHLELLSACCCALAGLVESAHHPPVLLLLQDGELLSLHFSFGRDRL